MCVFKSFLQQTFPHSWYDDGLHFRCNIIATKYVFLPFFSVLRHSFFSSHPRPRYARLGEASSAAPDGDIMKPSTLHYHPHPHLVVRCARHYERAAALVVSAAVATASLFVELPPAKWQDETHTDSAARTSTGTEASSVSEEGGAVARSAEISGGGGVAPVQGGPQAQQRLAGLTVQQQGMARHMQAHVAQQERVRQNGLETQLKMSQERHRWEQQHQQQQQAQNSKRALPVGATVTSRAAARIDLAGGWTDTPPISYEAGGSVVNVAVTVSGEKSVVARCERIQERRVELVCEGREGSASIVTTCTELEDFT